MSIGNNITITGVKILTHDASTFKKFGYTKVGRVTIGNDCFIGYGTIILPDTHIGNKVIVGAGCVVAKNIPDNSVVVGNPCRMICSYDEYMSRMAEKMKTVPCFDLLPEDLMLEEHQTERIKLQESGTGFVR